MSFLSSTPAALDQLLIRVKQVNTEKVHVYKLPINIGVSAFIYKIVMYASQDVFKLNVDDHESINKIVIIASGQSGNGQPENAPHMRPERATMLEKYGENLSLMTFYVKMIQVNYY
jgi:hypothetical protein